ncbi:MAG: hypothetical protein JSV80_18295 [Acidobacteriota bacterium]|nr:MAG: hypothetical protein JSV80_18295 [Acidobacteriota bacterium]
MRWRPLALLAIFGSAVGCTTAQYGRMPETRLLAESLTRQVSTKEDVLRVLGPPRGYGLAEMAGVDGSRTIWYYESTKATTKDIDFAILLVFFDGGDFDGYMWFSSLEKWSTRAGEQ